MASSAPVLPEFVLLLDAGLPLWRRLHNEKT